MREYAKKKVTPITITKYSDLELYSHSASSSQLQKLRKRPIKLSTHRSLSQSSSASSISNIVFSPAPIESSTPRGKAINTRFVRTRVCGLRGGKGQLTWQLFPKSQHFKVTLI